MILGVLNQHEMSIVGGYLYQSFEEKGTLTTWPFYNKNDTDSICKYESLSNQNVISLSIVDYIDKSYSFPLVANIFTNFNNKIYNLIDTFFF